MPAHKICSVRGQPRAVSGTPLECSMDAPHWGAHSAPSRQQPGLAALKACMSDSSMRRCRCVPCAPEDASGMPAAGDNCTDMGGSAHSRAVRRGGTCTTCCMACLPAGPPASLPPGPPCAAAAPGLKEPATARQEAGAGVRPAARAPLPPKHAARPQPGPLLRLQRRSNQPKSPSAVKAPQGLHAAPGPALALAASCRGSRAPPSRWPLKSSCCRRCC